MSMEPSNYDHDAPWNSILTKDELQKLTAEAVVLLKIHGHRDTAMELWRIVRSFGTPVLQQFIWRSLLINGVFIGREENTLVIETPDNTSIDRLGAGWFVGANVLTTEQNGFTVAVYVDYEIDDQVTLIYRRATDGLIIDPCPITGIRTDEHITPDMDTGFVLPRRV